MNKSFLPLILILDIGRLFAQNDSTDFVKKASESLKNKTSSVSTILTDKKYFPAHGSPAFRKLIKQHAPVGSISIIPEDEPGQKIELWVTLVNDQFQPVSDALVYIYQTDSRGWYSADNPHTKGLEGDRKHARLFGYVKSNEKGEIKLLTIKPAGVPDRQIPGCIHVEIEPKDYRDMVSKFLFADDPRLTEDGKAEARAEGFMVGMPNAGRPPVEQIFVFFIRMSPYRR